MTQFNLRELEKRLGELGKEVQEFAENIGFTGSDQQRKGFSPRYDAVVESDTITLYMDLPGMEKEDVQITTSENTLIISGSRDLGYAEEAQLLKRERSSGAFTRSFSMPGNAKQAGIKAAFRNGVLTVKIPLEPETPVTDTIIIE